MVSLTFKTGHIHLFRELSGQVYFCLNAVTPFNKAMFLEFSMKPQCLFHAEAIAFSSVETNLLDQGPRGKSIISPAVVSYLTLCHLLLFTGQNPLQFFSSVANHYTVITTLMVGNKNTSAVMNCESKSGWN